ncbi:MAG TPA: type II toxin-antitoxin system VapC family toxin [Rhodocyclaceae bacterium]
MLYLDTSVVLTLFVAESTSAPVEEWLSKRRQPLAFSDWGLTECASALGIKQRRGEISLDQTQRLWQAVQSFANEVCELISCGPQHQSEAQRWLGRFDLSLRAGDALHLAIARQAQATLVSYDKPLLLAAQACGGKFRNPLDD